MLLPDFSLTGRVALITGAARGIGLAIAKAFYAAGAFVVIQDIEEPLAQQEAAALGERAHGIGGDATDIANAEKWIAATVAKFGGLHILVNNASIQKNSDFFEQSDEEIHRQFDANVHTILRLCQHAHPHMKAAGWGRILNIGSIQGMRGNGHMTPYSMTKAAIDNMTRSLGRRFGKENITVNCIAPGWMMTYRNRGDFTSPQDKFEKGKWIPVGRAGDPEDCAGPALLLCSNAGAYMTGQTLHVDGGMSI